MTDTAWMRRGKCAEESDADQSIAELFFPDPGGVRDANDAKAICRRCEVSVDCLRFAMENAVEGIWGGTTFKERQEIRRRGLNAPPVKGPRPIAHGTPGGAKTHQRRGEPPCPECRTASADYSRKWKAKDRRRART